ncbi:unnamed protein product [Hydatigera taeniaeformis]|uniref:Secreted protein n=1 Tax=Hydatigena taeniaeformis TaxID=6205 RepID=A0A0R3WLX7_HYDTA|nr:unnamed protein product [Hydatigera taeniaeformis]
MHLSVYRANAESHSWLDDTGTGTMAPGLTLMVTLTSIFLQLTLSAPSTKATSLVTIEVEENSKLSPAVLSSAVWRAVKDTAKKVGKAIKEFVVNDVVDRTYTTVKNWATWRFSM